MSNSPNVFDLIRILNEYKDREPINGPTIVIDKKGRTDYLVEYKKPRRGLLLVLKVPIVVGAY